MTVRVDKEARARIDNIKNITKETKQHIDHIKKSGGYMSSRVANDFKEIVLDDSYKDIHNKGWIYTSPDGGKTIHRRPIESYVDGSPDYDDVSGVKLDRKSTEQISFVEIFDRISSIEREVRNLRDRFVEMERNT